MSNSHMNRAKEIKNNDFFTFYKDVAAGLERYEKFFIGKKILCPFGDANPDSNNFYTYFKNNFKRLKLKKLVALSYHPGYSGVNLGHYYNVSGDNFSLTYDGVEESRQSIWSGDYADVTNTKHFKEADLIVSNPPFSILRKIRAYLDLYEKQFILIVPMMFLTSGDRVRSDNFLGAKISTFNQNGVIRKVNCFWLSNFDAGYKLRDLPDTEESDNYHVGEGKNDNCYSDDGVLFVRRVKKIPYNYNKVMLVPVTMLTYNYHKKLELINVKTQYTYFNHQKQFISLKMQCVKRPFINKTQTFLRILVKSKGGNNNV